MKDNLFKDDPRFQALEMVSMILRSPMAISSNDLMFHFGWSEGTLRRRLREARGLGVEFSSHGERGVRGQEYVWRIDNAEAIQQAGYLEPWLDMYRRQSLVNSGAQPPHTDSSHAS